jgi:hypothetical protein
MHYPIVWVVFLIFRAIEKYLENLIESGQFKMLNAARLPLSFPVTILPFPRKNKVSFRTHMAIATFLIPTHHSSGGPSYNGQSFWTTWTDLSRMVDR